MAGNPKVYPHRRNKDGSYDSICVACFATVGHSMVESELAVKDLTHICDSAFLAERGILTRTDSGRPSAVLGRRA